MIVTIKAIIVATHMVSQWSNKCAFDVNHCSCAMKKGCYLAEFALPKVENRKLRFESPKVVFNYRTAFTDSFVVCSSAHDLWQVGCIPSARRRIKIFRETVFYSAIVQNHVSASHMPDKHNRQHQCEIQCEIQRERTSIRATHYELVAVSLRYARIKIRASIRSREVLASQREESGLAQIEWFSRWKKVM